VVRAAGFEPAAPCSHRISDVALAAFLHDAGKVDPRFQALLTAGDPLGAVGDLALAKSIWRAPQGAAARAGLPPRWRHEALSVRLAADHPRFREARDPDLVLWLIGVHHGWGRPFFHT
jgi:CRISPR-associated endonuclease/helicase Cas3